VVQGNVRGERVREKLEQKRMDHWQVKKLDVSELRVCH
jgi:hypothetical protein